MANNGEIIATTIQVSLLTSSITNEEERWGQSYDGWTQASYNRTQHV